MNCLVISKSDRASVRLQIGRLIDHIEPSSSKAASAVTFAATSTATSAATIKPLYYDMGFAAERIVIQRVLLYLVFVYKRHKIKIR